MEELLHSAFTEGICCSIFSQYDATTGLRVVFQQVGPGCSTKGPDARVCGLNAGLYLPGSGRSQSGKLDRCRTLPSHPSSPQPKRAAGLRAHDSPPREQLGDLGPTVSQQAVGLVDDEVLLGCPRGLLHVGIEVVVPAFSALLAQPALQVPGHYGPLLVAITIYQLYDLNNTGRR